MPRAFARYWIWALGVLVLATPAAAQEGVQIDPTSPSGREYALPLEAARRQANSRVDPDAPVTQNARTAPLFGEGIGDERVAGSGGLDPREQNARGARLRRTRSSGRRSLPGTRVAAAAARRPPTPEGGMAIALLIAAGAAIAAAGVGTGLWLRSRRTSP